MLIDPRDSRPPLARFLALIVAVALAPAGCDSGNQSGDRTATSKDATKRQKEMYDFMKNEAPKAQASSKHGPRNHP
jgi:hypothetical protein